jgi:hypothetical protein
MDEAKRSITSIEGASGFRRVMFAARLRALEGDRAGAAKTLLDECPASPAARTCLELAVDLAAGNGDPTVVRQAVGRFIAVACEVVERCVEAHRHVAQRLEVAGDLAGALEHHTVAARQAPSSAAWLKVADLGTRVGAVAAVRAALAEVRMSGPLDEAQRREVARLEQSGGGVIAGP